MPYRINSVRIVVEVFEPFCGVRTLDVTYAPAPDDPFAAAAIDVWRREYVNAAEQEGESKWPMQL
jgi:hypothetical protein